MSHHNPELNSGLSRQMSLEDVLQIVQHDPCLTHIYQLIEKEVVCDPAHDIGHLLRVAKNTFRFLESKSTPDRNIVAAALLHDFVNLRKNHPNVKQASKMSATAAQEILQNLYFSAADIEEISLAIEHHSFSKGVKPDSFLGQALQDADRVEALGALGIMRLMSVSTRVGATFFHREDPWATKRILEDKSYAIDHIFIKLAKIPLLMNTKEGKLEAQKRWSYLEGFLEQLGQEIDQPYTLRLPSKIAG